MSKIEIESVAELLRFLETPGHNWARAILQGLDLTPASLDTAMMGEEFAPGSAFLGCRMSAQLSARVSAAGSLVVPWRPSLPFDPFRGSVYGAAELLAGYRRQSPETYLQTPDWLSYLAAMDENTKRKRTDLGADDAVFFRLHDFAIEDALDEYLKPDPQAPDGWRRVVALMGGHDRERLEKIKDSNGQPTATDSPYMQAALVAWKLAALGFTIATGGGPGAMEAGNLGAWFADRSEADLRSAVKLLERVPKVQPIRPGSPRWNSGEWLDPAFEVIEKFPRNVGDPRTESVGVPTWFYGHEPPNPFGSHIGKYFENSLREEGLLAIATHGVIFAEGNAGTVQEIFQDGCQNYYFTYGEPAPMVLLGTKYWNKGAYPNPGPKDKPVWPLLQQLGAEKKFGHLLLLSDDLDEVVTFVRTPPKPVT